MDATPYVLRHTEGGCKSINGTGGVGEDGEFGDFESLADGVDII